MTDVQHESYHMLSAAKHFETYGISYFVSFLRLVLLIQPHVKYV